MENCTPRRLALTVAWIGLALSAAPPALAQTSGALEAQYPEIHALLVASHRAQEDVLVRVATELKEYATRMPMRTDSRLPMDHAAMDMDMTAAVAGVEEIAAYEELVAALRRAGEGGSLPNRGSPEEATGLTARLMKIVDRTQTLQMQILDIYADQGITDRISAVERVLADYLSDPEHALPAAPKSMDLLHLHPQATTFGLNFPHLRGLIWTSQWLQIAAFEPLFLLDTTEQRRAGMATVAGRFWSKLDDPPSNFPLEMPMIPTIAPGLRARHPEASTIFDNLNVLISVVADLVIHEAVVDKSAAVEEVVAAFTDPTHEVVSQYEWTLMALRHGIFDQGGPAIGTLTRSERNRSMLDHTQHGGRAVLPGMPGG